MFGIKQITTALIVTVAWVAISAQASAASFNDSGWVIQYQENFDTDFEAIHGQKFGTDDWLIFQLINGGAITVANGYAWLNAPDFWNAALIRSTGVLPNEYKVRTKIGYINYDLANYEQVDFDDPDFNTHGGYYENGMYFLTITNDTCSGNQCDEFWWHYHRKMVIDVDNHINYGGGETFHPVYMVYMAPNTNSGGNLLRTWDGVAWDDSPWNWNVAYTYADNTWYYAELEKKDNHITLRLYDEYKEILEETTPVSLDQIFAMDVPEYLYLGEPHTDDYEGDVRIDEITLLYVDIGSDVDEDVPGDVLPTQFTVSQNYPNPFNPVTTIRYRLPTRCHVKIDVYNALGRKVWSLVDREQPAGSYKVNWDGRSATGQLVSTGLYLYRFQTDDHVQTKKMLLLK
jgi:hypothetical protein